MNRLTEKYSGIHVCYKNGYKNTVLCSEMTVPQTRECMDKLSAYEDTGLEPEDILPTTELAEIYCRFGELMKYKELELEGRLIKLPCKVDDRVFVIRWDNKTVLEGKIYSFTRYDSAMTMNVILYEGRTTEIATKYFGITVFLTREEAEKVLKESEVENE